MKLCDTCKYRNNVEQLKPCIIYRDDCEYYEKERGSMTREEELDWLYRLRSEIYVYMPKEWIIPMNNALDVAIKVLEQEPNLEKIRERIELEKLGYPPSAGYYRAIVKVLQIIDKCRAERRE